MSVLKTIGQFFYFNWLPWQRPLTNGKINYCSIIGEKIAKISQERPEILDEIRLFFGRVVPDVLK